MLKIADPDKEFFVRTDAYLECLVGVLMQEGHCWVPIILVITPLLL